MPVETKPKRIVDRNGGELRERACQRREPTRKDARAELERRRDCLRGAVVADWEREARGEDVSKWELW